MTESRVVITADAGRAVNEFQRFRTTAVTALEGVSQAGGVIGNVLGAVGASLSVAAFTGWIKGAIDATDAASDLSQKTGVAIEDLAGLELAFQKGGLEAGALEGVMSKLSKQITDSDSALVKLGINSRTAGGEFKSNKDVLYELADRFASMEDGAQKAALAQEVFGKSGTAMIPLLNEGSDGLRQMDEMARKLGMTLSDETVEQAGNFNDTLDLLMLGGQGVARGIAAELLPTLSNLTGQFLTTMASGDRLKSTAQFLAAGFKLLYSVGIGVVEVFSTVGKTIGAAGAQIVAILQGNFSMAAEIGRAWQQDIGSNWTATLRSIEAAWTGTADGSVEAMSKFARNSTVLGQSAAELSDEMKKAAKAHEEEARLLAELSGLTGTFAKDWDKLTAQYDKGRLSLEQLTKAQAELLARQPAIKAASEEEAKERKLAAEAAERYADAFDRQATAKAKAQFDLQAQKEENDAIGLGALELAELTARRLESRAERAEENSEIAEGIDLSGELAEQYRAEARALRELADEQRSGARKKIATDEAKATADAYKNAGQSIEKSLTDALLRGFESGKSVGENLIDTLKNMFNTLVLRPVVSAVMNPIAGALGGMVGFPQAAAASGGSGGSAAGSLLGAAAGSIFGAGGLAGSLAAGAGWLTGATTLTGSLTAATSLMATGTLSGVASGLGMVAGALGPIALGIGAAVSIWKKLDTSGTYHTGGAATATGGSVSTIRAESLNFERTRTNAETEKLVSQLAGGVVNILDSTALAFGKTAGYTAATAFADDTSKDGAWGALVISRMGEKLIDWQDSRTSKWAPKEFADGAAGQKQYLEALSASVRVALDGIGLPAWAKSMLDALGKGAGLEEMAKVIESINSTQAALKAMGQQLVGFASLSDSAVSALLKAAGGIEALSASAASYHENFYSETEKTSLAQKQLADSLKEVGLAVPSTREQYRALVEQQVAMGEAGAPAVAVLLKMAGMFAQLHPVVDAVTESFEKQAEAARQAAKERAAGLLSNVDSAFSVLQRVVDREKSLLQARIDKERQLIAQHQALSSSLHAAIDSMGSPEKGLQSREEAQAKIRATLAIARAGGPLPSSESLQRSLGVLTQDASLLFATQQDYLRDFYTTQNDIAELAGLSDAALTIEERNLKALEDQVAQYDLMLAREQEQIDALMGLSTIGLSIEKALQALRGALLAAQRDPVASASGAINEAYKTYLGRAPDAAGFEWWKNAAASGTPVSQIVDGIANSTEGNLNKLYQSVLGRAPDAEGLAFWMKAYGSTMDAAETADFLKAAAKDPSYVKAPGFANGGNHEGGIRLVGELAPEVEVTGPARIHSMRDLMESLRAPQEGGLAVVAAIDRLVADNAGLRKMMEDHLYAIAKYSRETADHLDSAFNGDKPLPTKAIPQ